MVAECGLEVKWGGSWVKDTLVLWENVANSLMACQQSWDYSLGPADTEGQFSAERTSHYCLHLP